MHSRSRSRSSSMNSERSGQSGYIVSEPSNTIYVSHLPSDMTQDDMHVLFGTCGPIEYTKVVKKEDGFTFGFVNYHTEQNAQLAIEKLNGKKLGDKMIKVKFGIKKPKNTARDTDKKYDNQYSKNKNQGRNYDGQRGGPRDQGKDRKDYQKFKQGSNDKRVIKCYQCQQEGHMSKDCPNSDKNNSTANRFHKTTEDDY